MQVTTLDRAVKLGTDRTQTEKKWAAHGSHAKIVNTPSASSMRQILHGSGFDRIGLGRSDQVQSGQVGSGQVGSDQVGSDQVRSDQVG